MRYSIAVAISLVPTLLLGRPNDDPARAETLVRAALRQVTPPADAVFGFTQANQFLGHLARPWQTYKRKLAGSFLLADQAASYYQADSTQSGRNTYLSFTFCCDTTLAFINYGETTPQRLTVADKRDFVWDVSAMTPVYLMKDFLAHDIGKSLIRFVEGAVDTVVYRAEDGNIVSLMIDPRGRELAAASMLTRSDLYGDVLKSVTFGDYADGKGFRYPRKIVQSQLGFDANVVDVTLSDAPFDRARVAAMIPATYRLAADEPKPAPDVEVSTYAPGIHAVDLKHASERALVVEFKDQLLVAEAPLTVANGELMLAQARKIAPGKPVRWFVFGHHHPHYLGGLRAFVHAGVPVLTAAMDTAYLRQIATFRHTLEPDSLERDPRPLKLEVIEGEKAISDGDMEMRIIHIGSESKHTEDYLVYYFPKQKLLFEDDLASVPSDKPLRPASERQRGLYDAITSRGLEVETIMQGWPLGGGGKTVFTFDELRKSVEMADQMEKDQKKPGK